MFTFTFIFNEMLFKWTGLDLFNLKIKFSMNFYYLREAIGFCSGKIIPASFCFTAYSTSGGTHVFPDRQTHFKGILLRK